VAALPRQPGAREVRYAQLLCGEPAMPTVSPGEQASGACAQDRLTQLESEVAQLRQEINQMREQLAALKPSVS
jgi:uncharacterized protein YceH (UPF0502 family)